MSIGIPAFIGAVFVVTAMPFFETEEKRIYDDSEEQLEIILNHCGSSKDLVDTVIHAYYNDTHSINTASCEWTLNAQIPTAIMPNPKSLDKVLEYCNDTSPVRYLEVFYYYYNDTHSINVDDCIWKHHQPYPNGKGICIPYADKWLTAEDWNNKTHYFDTTSCTWKVDPEYDFLNSKGCPQFCPKEKASDEDADDFDKTWGGPGNRHPAFLGFDIPKICSEDMIKHLAKYSSMFDRNAPYMLEWVSLDESINADDFDICVEELLERNPKEIHDEK